jgi:hypothetical protein
MAATNPLILAVDFSGSTGGQVHYWRYVAGVLRDVEARGAAEGREVKYVLWDTKAKAVTKAQLEAVVDACRGHGGTQVGSVAHWLSSHHKRCRAAGDAELALITDGETCVSDIEGATKTMAGVPLLAATCHLVHTGGDCTRSVTCPFTRAWPHTVYEVPRAAKLGDAPERAVLQQVSAADLALLPALDAVGTPAELDAVWPALERVFVARLMGTAGDAALRERVLALSRRLTAWAATHGEGTDAAARLHAALLAGDEAAADAEARAVVAAAVAASGGSIVQGHAARVSWMLRMTEGALVRAFTTDDIASQRAVAASVAAPATKAAVDALPAAAPDADGLPAGAAAEPFTCPLTWADDDGGGNVVLLLKAGAPLLTGLPKATVDALLDCPLALTRPDMAAVRAALVARLDHAVSLEALQRMLNPPDAAEQGVYVPHAAAGSDGSDGSDDEGDAGGGVAPLLSPVTRQPLQRGGVCLGSRGEHAAATDAALFTLLAGGKKLGSADLWFAALAYVLLVGCDEGGAAPWLQPAHAALLSHLRWRLRHRTSFASLSGLATTVTTRMPLGAAAWFVLGGAAAHNDVAPRTEALRMHAGHVKALTWLVTTAARFPVSARAARHVRRTLVLLQMLRLAKTGGRRYLAVRAELRALYQASLLLVPAGAALPNEQDDGGAAAPATTDELLRAVRAREGGGAYALLRRVFLDGPADAAAADEAWAALPASWRALTRAEVVGLAAVVGAGGAAASKSASEVGVGSDWVAPPLPAPVTQWPGYKAFVDRRVAAGRPPLEPPPGLEIVPATMRPRYQLAGDTTWRDAAEAFYGMPAADMVSTTRHFLEFTCRYGAWPTRAAFLLYLFARQVSKHGADAAALVCIIGEAWDEDEAAFAPLVAAVPAAEAARRYRASVAVKDRVRLERS